MATDKLNPWDQATQVLRGIKSRRKFGTLEAGAIDYALQSIEKDKNAHNGLVQTEQAIRETEAFLAQGLDVS